MPHKIMSNSDINQTSMAQAALGANGAGDLLPANSSRPEQYWLHRYGPTLAVMLAACLYAVLMSFLSLLQDQGLKTQMNDLGNMDQALWNLVNGDWAMTQSNCIDGNLRSRLGVHGNLIFYPLALAYQVFPDRRFLLIIMGIAGAAAGLGLHAYARRHWGPTWWSVAPSFIFWLSPLTQDAILYDFNVTTLAVAFLIWAVWAFEGGRQKTAWLLFGLMLSCKEDMPFFGLALGLYFTLNGDRHLGTQIAYVSLAYLLLLFSLVIPVANHGQPLIQLSETAASRINWDQSWQDRLLMMLQPDRLRLPVYFLISGAIFVLKEWKLLLLLLIPVAEGMGANTVWMTRLTGVYYWIPAEAVIVMALVRAAAPASDGRIETWRIQALAGTTLLLSLLFSPLPYSFAAPYDNYKVIDEAKILDENIAALIPANASLSVQNNLGPRFSHRGDVASFPRRLDTAEFVLLHLRFPGGGNTGFMVRNSPRVLYQLPILEMAKSAWLLVNSEELGLIAARDGFYLFARDQPSQFSLSEAKSLIQEDYGKLVAATLEADQQQVPWSELMTGPVTWLELFGLTSL